MRSNVIDEVVRAHDKALRQAGNSIVYIKDMPPGNAVEMAKSTFEDYFAGALDDLAKQFSKDKVNMAIESLRLNRPV